MRAMSSLFIAATLVLGGTAYAQTAPPPNTTEDASSAAKTAAPSQPSNSQSPGTVSPSTGSNSNQSSTHSLSKTCHKQATDKGLTGTDKTKFVKDCKMGKSGQSND
jgi:hypothetical protein